MKTKPKAGFTLIELLVVVAIIALLLAILVPAVNRARWQAKRTRVRAQLEGISVALESFAQELGNLPPSDPFGNDPRINPCYVPTGAHILAAALVGMPDGELPFRNKKAFMSVDKANAVPDTVEHARLAPFEKYGIYGAEGAYVLRDVTFGSPILYYRANRKAKYSSDPNVYSCTALDPGSTTTPAVYYLSDNALITGAPASFEPLSGTPEGWLPSGIFTMDLVDQAPWGFADYVEVEGTRADDSPQTARAQNADEFLLISAGDDGIFGPRQPGPDACDDIGNFTVPMAGPPAP